MNEMLPPLVSVIVPIFNEETLIADCLQSLLDQDYPNHLEIIAVDNGSSDQSAVIIKNFPVTYVLERRKGAAAARNAGARHAKGELLAFIDADCVAPQNWISKLVASLQGESYDIAGGDYVLETGRTLLEDYLSFRNFYSQKEFFFGNYPFLPWLLTGNLIVRRKAFFKVGGFEEIFQKRGEDIDFSWLLILNGGKLNYLPDHEILQQRTWDLKSFYSKLFEDGKAMTLLRHRYGKLCLKEPDSEGSRFVKGSFQKLIRRGNKILKSESGIFRKIAYFFFAITGHIVFLSGRGLDEMRFGLLKKPLPCGRFPAFGSLAGSFKPAANIPLTSVHA